MQIKSLTTALLRAVTIMAMAFLLSACSDDATETHDMTSNDESNAGELMSDDRPATLRTDALGREIDQAKNELAERMDVDASDIEISAAEFVTWSDGSLGCPELDMAYTQALVPGYRIILMVDGETYRYHGASERAPFYCPAERAGQPRPASDYT